MQKHGDNCCVTSVPYVETALDYISTLELIVKRLERQIDKLEDEDRYGGNSYTSGDVILMLNKILDKILGE